MMRRVAAGAPGHVGEDAGCGRQGGEGAVTLDRLFCSSALADAHLRLETGLVHRDGRLTPLCLARLQGADGRLKVERVTDNRNSRAMHGLSR